LGSASKNALIIFERLQITPYFEALIDGNSVEHSKPHPEVFLKGAQALGLTPADCVVFEDSQAGIIAAKAGGMTAVALGEPSLFTDTDYCYPNFNVLNLELLPILF
ncbi:MAG: HAD family hydrolase, partial [Flavobacteriaceae bacterium]